MTKTKSCSPFMIFVIVIMSSWKIEGLLIKDQSQNFLHVVSHLQLKCRLIYLEVLSNYLHVKETCFILRQTPEEIKGCYGHVLPMSFVASGQQCKAIILSVSFQQCNCFCLLSLSSLWHNVHMYCIGTKKFFFFPIRSFWEVSGIYCLNLQSL